MKKGKLILFINPLVFFMSEQRISEFIYGFVENKIAQN